MNISPDIADKLGEVAESLLRANLNPKVRLMLGDFTTALDSLTAAVKLLAGRVGERNGADRRGTWRGVFTHGVETRDEIHLLTLDLLDAAEKSLELALEGKATVGNLTVAVEKLTEVSRLTSERLQTLESQG